MPHAHHVDDVRPLGVFVLTVSTSRSPSEDHSGVLLQELARAEGHVVAGYRLVPDDPDIVGATLDEGLRDPAVHFVVINGGTGISARDLTPMVVATRLERVLPGFGELFRMLSWAEVGAAAMLSSALGGVARGRPVFSVPGSTAASRLAMEKLILPEIRHLVRELAKETPLPLRGGHR